MKLGKNSKRHRNPALYEWLVANYDRLKLEIGDARRPDDLEFSRVRWQWIESLPADYRGIRSTPLGVMMEWNRVRKEMSERLSSGDDALHQRIRSDDTLSQTAE